MCFKLWEPIKLGYQLDTYLQESSTESVEQTYMFVSATIRQSGIWTSGEIQWDNLISKQVSPGSSLYNIALPNLKTQAFDIRNGQLNPLRSSPHSSLLTSAIFCFLESQDTDKCSWIYSWETFSQLFQPPPAVWPDLPQFHNPKPTEAKALLWWLAKNTAPYEWRSLNQR